MGYNTTLKTRVNFATRNYQRVKSEPPVVIPEPPVAISDPKLESPPLSPDSQTSSLVPSEGSTHPSSASNSAAATPEAPVVIHAAEASSSENPLDALQLFLETEKLKKQAAMVKAKVDARLNTKAILEGSDDYDDAFESEKNALLAEEAAAITAQEAVKNEPLIEERVLKTVIETYPNGKTLTLGQLKIWHERNFLIDQSNSYTQKYNALYPKIKAKVTAEMAGEVASPVPTPAAAIQLQPVEEMKPVLTRPLYQQFAIFSKEFFIGLLLLSKYIADDISGYLGGAYGKRFLTTGKKWIDYPTYPARIIFTILYTVMTRLVVEPWVKATQVDELKVTTEEEKLVLNAFDSRVAFGVSVLVGTGVASMAALAVLTAAGTPINYAALYSMAIQPAAAALGLAGYEATGVYVVLVLTLYAVTALAMVGAGVFAGLKSLIPPPRKRETEMVTLGNEAESERNQNPNPTEKTGLLADASNSAQLYGTNTPKSPVITAGPSAAKRPTSPVPPETYQPGTDAGLTPAEIVALADQRHTGSAFKIFQ